MATVSIFMIAVSMGSARGAEVVVGQGLFRSTGHVAHSPYLVQLPFPSNATGSSYKEHVGLQKEWSEDLDSLSASAAFEAKSFAWSGNLEASMVYRIRSSRTSVAWTYGATRVATFRSVIDPSNALSEKGKQVVRDIWKAHDAGDLAGAAKLYGMLTGSVGDEFVTAVTMEATVATVFRRTFLTRDEKELLKSRGEFDTETVDGSASFKKLTQRLLESEDISVEREYNGDLRSADGELLVPCLFDVEEAPGESVADPTLADLMGRARAFLQGVDMSTARLLSFQSQPWWSALGLPQDVGAGAKLLADSDASVLRVVDELSSNLRLASQLRAECAGLGEAEAALGRYEREARAKLDGIKSAILSGERPASADLVVTSPVGLVLSYIRIEDVVRFDGWETHYPHIYPSKPNHLSRWRWEAQARLFLEVRIPSLVSALGVKCGSRAVAYLDKVLPNRNILEPADPAFRSSSNATHVELGTTERAAASAHVESLVRQQVGSRFPEDSGFWVFVTVPGFPQAFSEGMRIAVP